MPNIHTQIDELEASANERELIANLSTDQGVRTRNLKLALCLRERVAVLRRRESPQDDPQALHDDPQDKPEATRG